MIYLNKAIKQIQRIAERSLTGVRGNLPYKIIKGKRAQGKTGFYAVRYKHSAKPHDMRAQIELVSHSPRIELFAREQMPGWDCWGNEIEKTLFKILEQ